MSKKTNLEDIKIQLEERKKSDIRLMLIVTVLLSVLIGLMRTGGYFIPLLGLVCGIVGTFLIDYDLKKYKMWLLKQEVYRGTKEKYVMSEVFRYLYFQSNIEEGVRESIEGYVRSNLIQFMDVIHKSGLQIVIVTEPLEMALNSLFKDLGKTFKIDENTSGLYVNELDYIVVRYFGLPVESCIGHEFMHFLLSKTKGKLLVDEEYKGSFEVEKDNIFPLVYQEYFKTDIEEFTAELGATLINNMSDKELLGYRCGKLLFDYIDKFKNENYTKKLLN